MLQLAANPAFRLYAACSILLVVMMYVLGFRQASTRIKHGITLNPEDRTGGNKQKARPAAQAEHPDVERTARVYRNAQENVPFFLVLGLMGVLAGVPLLALQMSLIGFTVSRFVYTFAYLNALQPWRSLSFGVGALANLALGVLTLVHVY